MISATVTVFEVGEVTVELVAAFARLLPQLSSTAPALGHRELTEIVQSSATTLFLARDAGDGIVGAVTLAVFRIPTGKRGRIESLVVDGSARGRGVGEALCRAALERARALSVDTVDLTSAASRVAANRLYEKLGFQRRDTNVYRCSIVER